MKFCNKKKKKIQISFLYSVNILCKCIIFKFYKCQKENTAFLICHLSKSQNFKHFTYL